MAIASSSGPATAIRRLPPPVVLGEEVISMSTFFQPRWRAWITVAIVIAVAVGVVLVIAYSGGDSGSGGGY